MKKSICTLLCLLALLVGCQQASAPATSSSADAPASTSTRPEEDSSELASTEPLPPAEESYLSPYSGLPIRKDQVNKRPLMVMIDNQKRARPQANLSSAAIVWEMRVEGEFTRYLALFERDDQAADRLIGPIRSARPNFVTIAHQYGGLYTHHGGSKDGLQLIRALGMQDLDGMNLMGKLFFRYGKSGKKAPHNSYLKLGDAFRYAEAHGWQAEGKGPGFLFHPHFEALASGKSAQRFRLNYTGKLNNILFEYDPSDQTYTRTREGRLQVDEGSGQVVRAKNVILQYADSYLYDRKGHRAFHDTGSGRGYYVTGGKYQEITWTKKDNHTSPTRFFNKEGAELTLNPGQTWICVIDKKMDPHFE